MVTAGGGKSFTTEARTPQTEPPSPKPSRDREGALGSVKYVEIPRR
jgi:hypothetical protein